VEDSIHKQWFHDGHTEIVSMRSADKEFREKICQTAEQATTHHFTVKS
jgi:hypothetical protein